MADANEALTPEERAVLEQFREAMQNPEMKQVTVVNESLGQLLDGTKIQYRPGAGKELSPALPPAQRYAARERRRIEAREAAKRRAERGREQPLFLKVEEAKRKLDGANVSDTIAYIKDMPNKEQEIYLLAEADGPARISVLKSFPKIGAKVSEQYRKEREVFDELRAE